MLGMIIVSVAILSVAFLPFLPSPIWVMGLLLPAVSLHFSQRLVAPRYRPAVRFLASGLLGVSVGIGLGWRLVSTQLPESLEGQNLYIRGYVSQLPDQRSNLVRFEFRLLPNADNHPDIPQKLLLSWYGQQPLRVGQQWDFEVRLRRPRGSVNQGGLDYQRWLLSQGIGATGYVRQAELLTDTRSLLMPELREKIKDWLTEELVTADEALLNGPILALGLGDRTEMSQAQWGLFRQTGTSHLLAISGLHVGIVALLGWYLGAVFRSLLLFATGARWVYLLPNLFSCSLAFVYAGLAGFAVPTQRALVMVVMANVYLLSGRQVSLGAGFATAMLVVVLLDPLAGHDMGFWLSFGAVAVLILTFSGHRSLRGGFWQWLRQLTRAQFVLLLGLAIPLLCFNQPLALSSPLANLIAVPWVSFTVVMPLVISLICSLWAPGSAGLLLEVATFSLGKCIAVIELLNDFGANFTWSPAAPVPGPFWLGLGFFGLLVLLLPVGRLRYLAALLMLPTLVPVPPSKPPLQLTVLDVGQGLAVVIETPNHTVIYDAGPSYGDRFDAGSGIVLPYLRAQGISTIAALVVSHGDNDHAGGVRRLLPELAIGHIYQGQTLPWLHAPSCHQTTAWHWDGVKFEFLQPQNKTGRNKTNNYSCLLLVSWRDQKILIPGDVEKEVERVLLGEQLLPHDISVVIAPHHGSNTSSSARFVNKVHPSRVIYSAGYRSRYGHPHAKVQARYSATQSRALNTAHCGQIQLRWNWDGEVEERLLRIRAPGYWLDREKCLPKE